MYKRFYNSVRHFFEKDVDDLIMCKLGGIMDDPKFCGPNMPYEIARDRNGQIVRNEKGEPKFQFLGYDEIRKRRLDVASLIPNFLEKNDLKFVSLSMQPEGLETFKYDDNTCNVLTSHTGFGAAVGNRRNPDCFVPYTHSALSNSSGQRDKKVYSYEEFYKSVDDTLLESYISEDVMLKEWLYYSLGERDDIDLPPFVPSDEDFQEFRENQVRPCGWSRSDECKQVKSVFADWQVARTNMNSRGPFRIESPVESEARADMMKRVDEVFATMSGQKGRITREELMGFIHGDDEEGPMGSELFTKKMCSWMVNGLMNKFVDNNFFVDDARKVQKVAIDLYQQCAAPGKLTFGNPILKIDEKLRVFKTGDYRFKGGKSMNINVSAKTGIDQKDAVGAGWSFSLSGLAGLAGYGAAKAALAMGADGKVVAGAAVGGQALTGIALDLVGKRGKGLLDKSKGGAGSGTPQAVSTRMAQVATGNASKSARLEKANLMKNKLFTHVPAIGGLANGVSYGMKWDSGTGKSNGTDLNLGTYLVMQVATFDIQLEAFERCVVVKFDTLALTQNEGFMDLVVESKILPKPSFPLTRTAHEKAKAQANALDSGLMLCAGQAEQMVPNSPSDPTEWSKYIDGNFVSHTSGPKAIRERYYYFTQHFTEGDMLDSGDLYNHPWLLMLRGRRDFNIFMAGLNAFSSDPRAYWNPLNDPGRMIDGSLRKPLTMVNEYEWPIDNMVRTYLDIQPTFPGLYTALPNEPRDFPWGDEQPSSSFSPPMISGMGDTPLRITTEISSRYDVSLDPECDSNGGPAKCTPIQLDETDVLRKKGIEGMFAPEIIRGQAQ